jgi:hypothetical protein
MNTELNQEQLSACASALAPQTQNYNEVGESNNHLTPPVENYIRQIRIEQLSRGYIVYVGCQSFAFSTKEEMIAKLLDYIDRPAETETLWNKGELFQ